MWVLIGVVVLVVSVGVGLWTTSVKEAARSGVENGINSE
jgi:hypothetical protein